ncbi:phage tail tip fiber protein [Pseudomonas aeruginosa]
MFLSMAPFFLVVLVLSALFTDAWNDRELRLLLMLTVFGYSQALSATVGSNTAAIQQVSQAQTSTDGQLSAMWAVKMQVTAGGQYVAIPT